MQWMFSAVKLLIAAETAKKFGIVSYGNQLATHLKTFGDKLPEDYGGKGPTLDQAGYRLKLAIDTTNVKAADAPAVSAAPGEPIQSPMERSLNLDSATDTAPRA